MADESFVREMISYTLKRSVLGSELNQEELQMLADVCSLLKVEKNQYLFRQGDPALGFYIVHSGAVKVHKILADGREQVIKIFGALDSFAEIALSGTEVYPISASAIEESMVICVESAKLRALIRQSPDISLHIIASMSLHLKFLVERLEAQKFQQSDVRLARWLVEQLRDKDDVVVSLNMKKKTLAAELGITSETLSRALLRFKKQGWIEEENSNIKLLNKPAILKCHRGAE